MGILLGQVLRIDGDPKTRAFRVETGKGLVNMTVEQVVVRRAARDCGEGDIMGVDLNGVILNAKHGC